MNRFYPKSRREEKNSAKRKPGGFTLIELLVVVLIVGILAAVALPQYEIAVTKAAYAESMTMAKALHEAQTRCLMVSSAQDCARFANLDVTLPGGAAPQDYIDGEGTTTGEIIYLKHFQCSIYINGSVSCKSTRRGDYFNNPAFWIDRGGKRVCTAWQDESHFSHQVCKSFGGVKTGGGWNDASQSSRYARYQLP